MKFVQFFSLIGCSIQLITLFVKFLQFDIIAVIEFIFPEEITVPDITLCTNLVYAVNYQTFYINNTSLIPPDCSHVKSGDQLRLCMVSANQKENNQFASWVGHNFQVNTFYSKLVIKPEEIFTGITFWAKSLNQTNAIKKGICKTTPYIRDPFMCYTISCKNPNDKTNGLILHRSDLARGPNPGAIYKLDMRESLFGHWNITWIYLTRPGVIPRGFEYARILIKSKPKQPTLHFIRYKSIHVELRPFSYQKECSDYRRTHRLKQFQDCLNNGTSRFGSIAYSTFVNVSSNLSFANHLRTNVSYLMETTRIEEDCETKIRHPACTSTYLQPMIHGQEQLPVEYLMSNIMLMSPFHPDMNKKTKPLMSYDQLITFTGSILSFWLGFNIFHHVGQFFQPKEGQKVTINHNKLRKLRRQLIIKIEPKLQKEGESIR